MILILGASGYVGQAFAAYFEGNAINYKSVSRSHCDYYNPSELSLLLKMSRPRFVINCAGFTGKPTVDACELHKPECITANVYLPCVIDKVCHDQKIKWGHIASGCIYQGDNDGSGFSEADSPNFSFRQNNCSFYSGTKALSEELLSNECYQWRLRVPFSGVPHKRNYLTKLLSYPKIFNARNSLSYLDEFINGCYFCIEHDAPFGVYNMVNGGSVEARDVIDMLIEKGIASADQFEYFRDEEEFLGTVATPRSSCVLNNAKALNIGVPFSTVYDALRTAIGEYQS